MKSIEDRIWETRKCRINLERRLLSYARLTEWLIPWYSVTLIAIAMLPVAQKSMISLASTIGAVLILAASIITSSQNYRLRALQIRQQYVEMDRLRLRLLETKGAARSALVEQYEKELAATENHSNWDYLISRVHCRHLDDCTFPPLQFMDWIVFILGKFFSWLFVCFLAVGFPLVAFLILR